MFDKKNQFYPTPEKVIELMLEPYNKENHRGWKTLHLDDKRILEPSAGKGDILDYIKNRYRYSDIKLYAVEYDINLQSILKEKGYSVLHDDFLTLQTDFLFNMIIMNPPFNNGAKHLLYAWEILYEGEIICLLNYETIKNPYSEDRKKIQELIKQYGSVENIGNVFTDAEHTTDVDVALVRLTKPKNKRFDFKFKRKGTEKTPDSLNEETIKKGEVAVNDIIGNLLIQYDQLKESYVDLLKAIDKIYYYAKGLVDQKYSTPSQFIDDILKFSGSNAEKYNSFIGYSKLRIWSKILHESGVEKYMTTSVRSEFQNYILETGKTPITKENIYNVIKMIIVNSDNILEKAIVDAFEQMTKYSENRIDGWKTNDTWKVNKKVILPYFIRQSWEKREERISYGSTFSIGYNNTLNLSDIDKALCYIKGYNFNEITTAETALKIRFQQIGKIYSSPYPKFEATSTFFKLKFHLSGTLHITFLDKKLLEEFNYRAALNKNWIPHKEYDEWKAKRNGEKRTPKSRRIEEKVITNQETLF